MNPPEAILLDISSLLTLLGVLVALLSALYARRSASTARRQAEAAESALQETRTQSGLAHAAVNEARAQNRISVHGHRLEAYKALLSFSGQLTALGIHYKREALWSFWEYAQIAEFYFSDSVATNLKYIVDLSLELKVSSDKWSDGSGVSPSERKKLVEISNAQLERLCIAVSSADELMRKELRLVETEG